MPTTCTIGSLSAAALVASEVAALITPVEQATNPRPPKRPYQRRRPYELTQELLHDDLILRVRAKTMARAGSDDTAPIVVHRELQQLFYQASDAQRQSALYAMAMCLLAPAPSARGPSTRIPFIFY